MQCKMAFWLYGKVDALHLDNSTSKAYFCNQGGMLSTFLSRLACHILNQANELGITIISACIPTHLNMEADYPSQERLVPCLHNWGSISTLESTGGGFVHIFTYQSMSAILHLGQSIAFFSLGFECFQTSFKVLDVLIISLSCVNSSHFVHISGMTCHRSIQASNLHFTLLDGDFLASHCS